MSLYLYPSLPISTLFPYTTLFRSLLRTPAIASGKLHLHGKSLSLRHGPVAFGLVPFRCLLERSGHALDFPAYLVRRSEEHTSELQSHSDLVCRLLLDIKKMTFVSC